ncbi:flagellar hook-length control protein FliK [Marinobacter sp. F3R08]|uniref:flagellar hook-length control protein FliK n=1 Tax=Marinobacter sp. F3R08 TaxID=2841559 RepID=UPI001C08EB45|nr:flagellar hook-length control protein FliK [Marinobacter sp. F3R08]MBU2955278.1 flagellar hook-length control protein FliK [Marinobacter sp. F3R08]
MKLPSGQQPPTLPTQPAPQTSGPASTTEAGRESVTTSARQLLDQLQLSNRESALARVAEIINRQGGGSTDVLLDLRGKPLLVQAAVGKTELAPGDWVKVMRAGNELQLMGKLAPAPEAGIARALAQRLPWQQTLDAGLAKLMGTLTQGLKQDPLPGQLPSSSEARPLPEAARQTIEQLVARLPSGTSLTPGSGSQDTTPQQVRQWLSESGLFAESRLARTPDSQLPDLKLALGRVITALLAQQGSSPEHFNRLTPIATPELMQAPLQFPQPLATPQARAEGEAPSAGQMLRLLAGMLNRITVNQLHSQVLTTRGGGDAAGPAPASALMIDLPWLTPQNEPRLAQVRIEQYVEDKESERESPTTATAEWRLSLSMDLDEAGPLHFDVALRQQSVSARVWAEKQTTLRQVNQELPALRQSLTELGLDVTDLDCRRGTPQSSVTRLEHRLVDTRA